MLFFLPYLLSSSLLVHTLTYPAPSYSLINSVDFHPKENLFCVTHAQGNRVVLYRLNAMGIPALEQVLSNPAALLSEPQHAAFSADGTKIAVANWTNQTITIYQKGEVGFQPSPIACIPPPPSLTSKKPHGIAFSPCGNFLAVAYGAAPCYGRAIALFRVLKEGTSYELASLLEGESMLPGIPKGIAFSPDSTCLLVTFADTNQLCIFSVTSTATIALPPKQIVQGSESLISRPEDVKISPDGHTCAITNSDQNSVALFSFDPHTNQITLPHPISTLKASFCFPHGIAFSPDGKFLLITEFGSVQVSPEGNINWPGSLPATEAKVHICKAALH